MFSIRKALVTGFGTGYLPLAPGSWGSLAVCGIYLACYRAFAHHVPREPIDLGPLATDACLLIILLASSWICVAYGRFAEQAFGKKDSGHVTIDEWAGQALSLLFLPVRCGDWHGALQATGVSFFLFRLFDSVKPPPLRRLEKLPFGWGVLLDDLGAAVYANLAAQLILRLWLFRGA